MKLLLTSAGLSTDKLRDEFIDHLTKPVEYAKVQVFYVRFEHPDFESFIEAVRQRFIEVGIAQKNISMFDLHDNNPPSLCSVDVVLMFGGNEYHYVNQIRKQGLVSAIREFLERDGFYIGVSAGSIIMGPDVNVEHWSMASNDIELEDTSGFGYVDFITVPHIDTRAEPEKVLEFHRETGNKMIYLTDKQGIFVTEKGYRII
jgi:dipeptidase E